MLPCWVRPSGAEFGCAGLSWAGPLLGLAGLDAGQGGRLLGGGQLGLADAALRCGGLLMGKAGLRRRRATQWRDATRRVALRCAALGCDTRRRLGGLGLGGLRFAVLLTTLSATQRCLGLGWAGTRRCAVELVRRGHAWAGLGWGWLRNGGLRPAAAAQRFAALSGAGAALRWAGLSWAALSQGLAAAGLGLAVLGWAGACSALRLARDKGPTFATRGA